MGFLQIIDFHTDHYDEFVRLERQWVTDTDGQRTAVGGQLYVDRDDPTHYVALDWFTDYDSAMVNSALPGTSAFAEKATALSTADVPSTTSNRPTSRCSSRVSRSCAPPWRPAP